MANVIFNRVVQTVASAPGTGNITLSNAVAGYQTLAQAGSVDATTTAYLAEDGTMWEYGSATISSSGTVLARSVTRSYNGSTFGSSAVSLTANAIITITPRAEDLTSASTINSGVLAVSYGGTGITSLTAGYIPYGNGTGAFSSGANLQFDGSSLSVSQASNAQGWVKLRNTDAGSSASSGVLFGNDGNAAFGSVYLNSSTNTGIGGANGLNFGTYGAYPLVFFTSAGEKMRLDAAGNLGLGVTPSAWSGLTAFQLPDYGTIASKGANLWTGSNFYYVGGGVNRYATTAAATQYTQQSGAHYWFTAPSGTAGNAISFTQAMTLDASGRLGINNGSPLAKLHIGNEVTNNSGRIYSSAANGTSAARTWAFGCDNSTNAYGFSITDTLVGDYFYGITYGGGVHTWKVSSTPTTAMTLDASGRLGIGTTSPSFALDVFGNQRIYYNGTGGNAYTQYANASKNWYLGIRGDTSNVFALADDTSFRFVVDTSGNVGIGTSSPQRQLDVNGSIRIPSGAVIECGSTAVNTYIAAISGASGYWAFGTNNAERARIDSSGNLLVGTTNATLYNAGTGVNGIAIHPNSLQIASNDVPINCNQTTSGTGNAAQINFWRNGTFVGSIQSSSTGTALNQPSDISLKTNIANAASSLASILALPVRQFDWKSDNSHTDYGVVAQEAYEHAPEMVTQGELWSVDYGRITPRLIKAFQELAAKVTALEAKQ